MSDGQTVRTSTNSTYDREKNVSLSDRRTCYIITLPFRGLFHLVAAATPQNIPVCALKLGGRAPLSGIPRGLFAGFSRARSSSAATHFGEGDLSQGVFFVFFLPRLKRCHRRGAHPFRGGGAPKNPKYAPCLK
jgi:hypothetical protein